MATAIKERPILFSGPMVRAILDGRKAQTRRLIKPQPDDDREGHAWWRDGWFRTARYEWSGDDHMASKPLRCPFGEVGDLLWVRETWSPYLGAADDGSPRCVAYKADGAGREPFWKHSIHMPRWASRITLEITGVKVERLQEISEEDAVSEGVPCGEMAVTVSGEPYWSEPRLPINSFRDLWSGIHGPKSWASNPWVWVISFKRV